jgi:hypothetical protein
MMPDQEQQKEQPEEVKQVITIDVDLYQELLKRSDEYVKLNQALFLQQINTDDVLESIVTTQLQQTQSLLNSIVAISQIKQKIKRNNFSLDINKQQQTPQPPEKEDNNNKNI